VPADEREVDRYWVNAPYAYVVITYDEPESEHRYYAVEPELDAFERELLARDVDDIRDPLLYREGAGKTDEETLRTELEALLEGYGVEVGMDTFHALAYYHDNPREMSNIEANRVKCAVRDAKRALNDALWRAKVLLFSHCVRFVSVACLLFFFDFDSEHGRQFQKFA
jgi:hypothetical protein